MNLILIEGVAGSGKSSTTHLLALHLERLGHEVEWWFEQDAGHPIYPAEERLQYDREIEAGTRREIREKILARWRALATALSGTRKLVIMECGFLQMVIDHCLLLDLPAEEAIGHVLAVESALAPLQSLLIMLYEEDVAASLHRPLAHRTEGWGQFLVELYRGSPYGRAHGIHDFDGVIEAVAQGRKLAERIVSLLKMRTLRIEISAGDWPRYYQLVTDALKTPSIAPASPSSAQARDLPGRYRAGSAGDCYEITAADDALYLSRQARLRLLPTGPAAFDIIGTRWRLEFATDPAGSARSATLTDAETGASEVWTRV